MKLRLLSASMFSAFTVSAMAAGGFSVSPQVLTFDMSHKPMVNQMYNVYNSDTEISKITVSMVHYLAGSSTPGPFVNDQALPMPKGADYDLTPYVFYSPKVLMIEPKSSRAVRVSIKLPGGLPDGTYYTAMLYQIAPPPAPVAAQQQKTSGVSTQVTMLLDQSIMIYANVGKPDYTNTAVNCVNKGAGHIVVSVKNASPFVFDPNYNIYTMSDSKTPVNTIKLVSVMGYTQGTRDYTFDTKDTTGKYQITWQFAKNGPNSNGMIVCQ